MSSIGTSSDDERLEKPAVERKVNGVQIQEPLADLAYVRHNIVDYALYLCRGRKNPRLNSKLYEDRTNHDNLGCRLVVLDEASRF